MAASHFCERLRNGLRIARWAPTPESAPTPAVSEWLAMAAAHALPEYPMDTRRLRELAISETGFIFDPWSGLTWTVNPSGRFILEQLKAGVAPDEVPARLRSAFAMRPTDDPDRDVRECVTMLHAEGLLPRGGAK
jgi:hypothetical protein